MREVANKGKSPFPLLRNSSHSHSFPGVPGLPPPDPSFERLSKSEILKAPQPVRFVYRLSFPTSITLICFALFACLPSLRVTPKTPDVTIGENGEASCGKTEETENTSASNGNG